MSSMPRLVRSTFLAVERRLYRVCGIDPEPEQRWTAYAYSLIAFSVDSFLLVYLLQRLQGSLTARTGW